MSAWRKAILVVLSFFTAGLACGLIIGHLTSIDYSKPSTAVNFVATYGQWERVDSKHGSLTLHAGNLIYTYRTGDSEVSRKYLSALELAQNPPPRMNFEQDVDKLTALALAVPPSAGIAAAFLKMVKLGNASRLVKEEHQGLLIAASAATLGGGVVGYFLGHRSKPDYDNEVFQKTLQDPSLWSQLEAAWRNAYLQAVKLRIPSVPNDQPGDGRKRRMKRPMSEAMQLEVLELQSLQSEGLYLGREKTYLQKVFELHPEIEAQVASDPLLTGIENPGQ